MNPFENAMKASIYSEKNVQSAPMEEHSINICNHSAPTKEIRCRNKESLWKLVGPLFQGTLWKNKRPYKMKSED